MISTGGEAPSLSGHWTDRTTPQWAKGRKTHQVTFTTLHQVSWLHLRQKAFSKPSNNNPKQRGKVRGQTSSTFSGRPDLTQTQQPTSNGSGLTLNLHKILLKLLLQEFLSSLAWDYDLIVSLSWDNEVPPCRTGFGQNRKYRNSMKTRLSPDQLWTVFDIYR